MLLDIFGKRFIKIIIPDGVWKYVRRNRIIHSHAKTVAICEKLIEDYFSIPEDIQLKAKKDLGTEKIIWQYWAQGYDDIPERIRECLDSVEKYAGEYSVIRLHDSNLSEYLDIPEYIIKKRACFSYAFFSDLLRVMLLSTYGGLWLDATVLLTGQIPREYSEYDFFLFQRDPDENHKDYWENVYAYYFCWDKRFRVNMLSSIFFARKDTVVINALAGLMMKWWKENDSVPDYFFFQILYDVLINGRLKEYKCPVVSDCPPHYLQQSMNDKRFSLMPYDQIVASIPIHKLTYK